MTVWKEVISDSSFNTAVAAGGREKIGPGATRGTLCNFLEVTNRDAVAVQIQLDGFNTAGRIFEVPSKSVFTLKPEEGIVFDKFGQKNLDGSVAEVADTILFRWGKSVVVG